MSKLRSVFGQYADRLQLVIDRSLDRFAPTWYQKYFDWGNPQQTLTYVSAIGRSRIEAAASVVDRDSATPLRSRAALDKLSGEIPAIRQMFKMTENDYRDFIALQAMQGLDDRTKMMQLLDLLFGDVKKSGDAPLKRIDIMCLQAISTGKINIDATTNPDGLAMDQIDLLMPADNFVDVNTSWDNAAAKPLTEDIPGVVKAGQDRGISFAKILISPARWLKFQQITEVKNLLSNFMGFKQAGNILVTLDNVNAMMLANRWPVFEIVDEAIGVEKDGKISTIRPFEDNNVSFIPDGKLGVIKNAIAMEQIRPVEHVSYATFRPGNRGVGVLISKWSQNEPFGEWTKGELNAFPAVEAIDSIYILQTTTVAS
jgi:hypothetical protein